MRSPLPKGCCLLLMCEQSIQVLRSVQVRVRTSENPEVQGASTPNRISHDFDGDSAYYISAQRTKAGKIGSCSLNQSLGGPLAYRQYPLNLYRPTDYTSRSSGQLMVC